ncbi:MAG: Thymidylate synthase ThyX [Candidatus Moranbacteria bacterium GW2011_GWE2_47_10]|nr:MAG: Thymidylate synthase ThyX [Candidatus Moranbacteria bacterium GW2011_GWE2_47_10]
MDKIKVKLLSVTPESVVNTAIAQPYDSEPSFELTRKVIGVKKHLSCAEHVVMNWHIEGTSRAELQEHMRHRIASPTVKSTRFALGKTMMEINLDNIFFTPDYSDLPADVAAEYVAAKNFLELQAFNCIRKLREKGVSNDLLKYLLPESTRTAFSWSINLRSFLNFIELRTDKRALEEIRHVAELMLCEIRENLAAKYVDVLLCDYFAAENNQ